MQSLSGLDALFSYNESRNTPMHIGSLSIYQADNDAMTFKNVVDVVERNLWRSPIFRRKLVRMPGNYDRPYWREQRRVAIHRHVKHITLPATDERQDEVLHQTIATLHAQPLDMSRPLWQIWFIDGFSDDPQRFALYMKVHHTAIDGISGTEIFASLHTLEKNACDLHEESEVKEKTPSLLDTLAKWMPAQYHWSGGSRSLDKMRKLGQLGSLLQARRKAALGEQELERRELNWVRSRFNNRISNKRVVEVVQFPLNDLRDIRHSLPHTTVNHVLLTIIGGALREYLLEKSDLPDSSLSTVVPMNVRQTEDQATGNIISLLIACLHTDIVKPLERMEAVRDSAIEGREQSLGLGKNTMQLIADVLPARTAAFGLRTLSALSQLPGETRLPFNTVVSSLAMPPIPLFFSGAKLQKLTCLGLLANHVGLFHTAVSYEKTMSLSILACKKIMPDPDVYAEYLRQSFVQLKADVKNG